MNATSLRCGGRCSGFTLLELMIVVVIVAIFASLAGPSFVEFTAAQRERNAASALYDSLLLARAEAIKRNTTVSLTTSDLAAGWTVTLPDSTVLRTQEAFSGLSFNPAAPDLSYAFTGRPPVGAANTSVIISSTSTPTCYKVTVDAAGRATVGQGCS